MSQSTFDEDELFGEAASEMKTDVQDALDQAQEAIPNADTIENTDGGTLSELLDNVDSLIHPDEVETALQEAKKQYSIGVRADAFDDEFTADVEAKMQKMETALEAIHTLKTASAEITTALTTLQNTDISAEETDLEEDPSTAEESQTGDEAEDEESEDASADQASLSDQQDE